MRTTTLMLWFVMGISGHLTGQSKEVKTSGLVIGDVVSFYSNELQEDRSVNIYLPQGYDPEVNIKYPVIYLLDGSIDEDFLHIVGIVQFGSFSWINMIPPSIVVGIANVDRKRDFTYPSRDKRDQEGLPTSGGSATFIKYLQNELIPFIGSSYKVNDTTTLIGQSLGGLIASEILHKFPRTFTNYIIVSPSLWWDEERMLIEKIPDLSHQQSVYIAVGKEGDVMERVARALFDRLSHHEKTFFEFLEDKDHGDALHQAVYNAFTLIFQKQK